jgi:FkbM family methyltransferase
MDNRFSNWYNIIDQNIQPIKQIFDQFYLGDGVVLDVGGNVGAFTDYVISKYPNSEIHIFEPVEKFKDYLFEKYNNTNVTFIPKGVSNIESISYIKCNDDNLGCNEISNSGEEISLITLDNYIEKNIKNKISFIKIDVEFYEPFVLDGMKKYIESTLDLPIIVIEHNYHLSPYKNIQDKVFEWLFNYYKEFDHKSYYNTKDVVLIPKLKQP